MGVADVITPKDAHLLGPQTVKEERLVGGHEQLRARQGRTTFVRQLGQQAGVEEVLRFFDTADSTTS